MTKPVWVSPDIGRLKVHVFASAAAPSRGKTPAGDEFSAYEFNPPPQSLTAPGQTFVGVYRLDDLVWF